MELTTKELLAQKIIAAVKEDNEFGKAFLAAEDVATMQKVLNDNGIAVTAADVEALVAEGRENLEKAGQAGELDENQLDEVSGGGIFQLTTRIASCASRLALDVFCGSCPAGSRGVLNLITDRFGLFIGYDKKNF